MGPDKECCAACDGANVVGCSFKGESECRPLKAKPRTVHTYDPRTHVVISKEAGEQIIFGLSRYLNNHGKLCNAAMAELRAALEMGR